MYEDAFETKFLKATEALYHEEGNRYMQETDVSYLRDVQYGLVYNINELSVINFAFAISAKQNKIEYQVVITNHLYNYSTINTTNFDCISDTLGSQISCSCGQKVKGRK